MNDKQKKAFAEIGKLVGVPDLVEQITASAHLKKEELDGKIEHKSVDIEPEQVPDTEDKSLAPSLTPEVVAMIAEALTPAIQGPTEPGKQRESRSRTRRRRDHQADRRFVATRQPLYRYFHPGQRGERGQGTTGSGRTG